jgi:hypothetical protein
MYAIAFSFEDGSIGMMRKTIKQRGNASGIREDLIPFLEGSICGDNDGTLFISTVDNFIEKIGSIIVVGKICQFINAQ